MTPAKLTAAARTKPMRNHAISRSTRTGECVPVRPPVLPGPLVPPGLFGGAARRADMALARAATSPCGVGPAAAGPTPHGDRTVGGWPGLRHTASQPG